MTFTISVDKCFKDSNKHRLYVTTFMGTSPCGFRLWKKNKFPIDKFQFDCKLEANEACKLLQDYVDNPENMEDKQSKKKEKYVEDKRSIFG